MATETSELYISDEFTPLRQRLAALGPLLADNADRSDESGRLTDEVVRAVHDSGVLKIGIPRELGGYEFSPRQQLETVAQLSYLDASVAWTCMALQLVTGTTAAYVGPAAAAELFPDVAGGRFALMAGQGTRFGTAKRVDGGFRVSGRWQFASGIALASHVHAAAWCAETEQALICTFPKEQATLIDNWDVLGLRSTGSIDYTGEDVFVPETHAFDPATRRAHRGGAIYRIGLATLAGISHTGWAIGVGRRLLDELKALAAEKTGTPNAAVDTQQFYAQYANAESRLRSAQAWAMQVWADFEETLGRGEMPGTEQETLARLALNNATWSAQAVGQTVHKWAGTAALRRGPIQRFHRDLNTGTQHVTSGAGVLQNCGKSLSGLAPGARWNFLALES
ncbi:acyl-CoA dehydrogenase family protein [Saccharopolyspora sp. NPDC050389]|uniref:acyl-CoA dehydrogenase family protein n=1 Tax=Saccharopolyspora sp. NPDC050389 TaxID=3155516 RepID=UPI0033DF6492